MKPRVLVVDDDAGVRYTLREILESADIQVFDASDGADAAAWLAENATDLVITDLRMPRMDGMKLLEHLQSAPPRPKPF